MEKKKFFEKRGRLDEAMRVKYIPFLGGRPNRTTVVNYDDILNLKIILYTTNSVEEFLENI